MSASAFGPVLTDACSHDQFLRAKISTIGSAESQRELDILRLMRTINTTSPHLGRECVTKYHSYFEIHGPGGKHICILESAVGASLNDCKKAFGLATMPVLRACFRNLVLGLYHLHNEHRLIHTGKLVTFPQSLYIYTPAVDVQLSNLMTISSFGAMVKYHVAEVQRPSPRKVVDGRTTHVSRPVSSVFGAPVLAGLGSVHFGGRNNWHDVMPVMYRAPEVVLSMPWSYPVDIWAAALTVCARQLECRCTNFIDVGTLGV
jgi:serine/threonine-protein kinase SRPK3